MSIGTQMSVLLKKNLRQLYTTVDTLQPPIFDFLTNIMRFLQKNLNKYDLTKKYQSVTCHVTTATTDRIGITGIILISLIIRDFQWLLSNIPKLNSFEHCFERHCRWFWK